MSSVSLTHQFAEGGGIRITVKVDDSYLDSIAEAEARCLSLYREAVPDVVEIEDE